MAGFGTEVFQYLTTLVPSWRVCDEAWYVADDCYLAGIGVLRNHGGQVLLIPWEECRRKELLGLRDGRHIQLDRVVVVVDDRSESRWATIRDDLAPMAVVPWSRRGELALTIIKDQP